MKMGNLEAYKVGFGSPGRSKEFDDAARAKARGVPRKRIWSKEYCIEQLEIILDRLKKILLEAEKIETDDKKLKREMVRDLNTMLNRVLEFMKYLYPQVQQNVNLNIDTTADKVMDRLREAKKEQEEIKEIMKEDGTV